MIFPETVFELLAWRRARAPSRPWLRFEGESWTLSEVLDLSERFALGLEERGVVKGDRVALLCGNRPETLFSWFGANRLGAIFSAQNPAFKPPELAAQLRLVEPRVLVVDDQRALAEAALGQIPYDLRPELVTPAELAKSAGTASHVDVLPDDIAVLLSTSGTTGAPKAVAQTHRTYALTAEAFPDWVGLTEADSILAALPLFHINAQAYSTMGALGAGTSLSLLSKFSASRFWDDVRRFGSTHVNVVGAMVHILMNSAPQKNDREHPLRICYSALALPEAQHREFETRFGVKLSVGYGMSETTFGTIWPKNRPPRYGSMGTLRQHPRLGEVNRARVVKDDASDAGAGEVGELWLQNPATMKEYWRAPTETEAALQHGWLHTGDLVRRDVEGYFTFVARKKEMIRRRGENISAAEIENALLAHECVGEAAVVAAPSELGEDEIVAYVAPRAGARIDVAGVREFLRARLADFKIPSEIRVRDALPRTATERIAKHLLK